MKEQKVEFNIYRFDWVLEIVDKTNENLIGEDDRIHSGITDFVNKRIYIRKDLNYDSFRYTLFHELVHAFIDSYGMLQVEWNDEIVADFVAIHITTIREKFEYVYDNLDCSWGWN